MSIAVYPITYIEPVDMEQQQLIRAKEPNISVYVPKSDAFYNTVENGIIPTVSYNLLRAEGFFFTGSAHIAISIPVTEFDKLEATCKEILPRLIKKWINKDVEYVEGQLIVDGEWRVGALEFGIAGRSTIFGPVLYVDMRNEHIETFNVCGKEGKNKALNSWNGSLTPEKVGEEIALEFKKVLDNEL